MFIVTRKVATQTPDDIETDMLISFTD